MSDYVIYNDKPDRDELETNTCQYAGCEDRATHVTSFRSPSEYVAYCRSHAEEMRARPGGKTVRRL